MDGAVQAWNSMSYIDGFFFTVWLVGIYYLKCKLDNHFTSKRKNWWSNNFKNTIKEAIREYNEEQSS